MNCINNMAQIESLARLFCSLHVIGSLVFFLTVQAVQSVQGGRRRGGQEEKPARRRKRGGGGGKEEEKRRRRGKGRGKEEEEGERKRKRGEGGGKRGGGGGKEEEKEEEEEEKRKQLIDFRAFESVLHPKRAHFQRGIVHSDSEKANFSPAAPGGRKQGEKGH